MKYYKMNVSNTLKIKMMKRLPIILLLFLAAALITSCSGEEQETQDEQGLVKLVNVESRMVEPQTFERFLRLVGTVESENDVQISAEVSGRIERFYVNKGDRIAKGAPILKIDDRKLLRQQAQLQAQAEQAREQYERLKRVFEQDSIGSEMNLIDAKAAYQERKGALESVEVDLNNTTVRAPFTAVFDEKMLDVGEMASPGMQLVRIIGSSDLKIAAGVPSRFSEAVSKGDEADVWFDFQQSDTLSLPISYVGQSIDQDARTFKVEIDLPAEARKYKVDMNANVKLRTLRQDGSIIVGEEYVYQKGNGFLVYTVAKSDSGNTVARARSVRLGPSYENSVVIENGLKTGEEIITVGSSFLQDSMRVKVVRNRDKEIAQQNNQ
jgi:RND family efflux transporter MFP subunit